MKKTWFKIGLLVISMLAVALFAGCDQATDTNTTVTGTTTSGSSSTTSTNAVINEVLAEVNVSVPSGYTEYSYNYYEGFYEYDTSVFLSPDNSEYIFVYYEEWDSEVASKGVYKGTLTAVSANIPNVFLIDWYNPEASSEELSDYEKYMYEIKYLEYHYYTGSSWGGNDTWSSEILSDGYVFMNKMGDTLAFTWSYWTGENFVTWFESQEDFDSYMTSGNYTKQ